MAFFRLSAKLGISDALFRSNNALPVRGFVSVTRPSYEVDKETCEKVIDAADTVKDGTNQVVDEVKRVGQVITDKAVNAGGKIMVDATKKGLEKASENADSEKSKDVIDTAKVATEAFKNKVDDKKI